MTNPVFLNPGILPSVQVHDDDDNTGVLVNQKGERATDIMKYEQYVAWEEEISENMIWIFFF